jgi:acid phosphatase type 7
VDSSAPTSNFGTAKSLNLDASPTVQSYVRFNVTGLTGTVTKGTLRIYVDASSSTGFDVRSVADKTWGETTLAYNNAPAMGASIVGSSGALTGGTWINVDVTSLVTGNGLVSLGLTTTSSTAKRLASRESGANAPQLVITTQ